MQPLVEAHVSDSDTRAPSLLDSTYSANGTKAKWCQAPKGFIVIVCDHGGNAWKALRCRRCPGCYRWRSSVTIARILTGVKNAERSAFVTLTSGTGTSWPEVMYAFKRLVRYQRSLSPSAQYVAVKHTGTRTGMKHLHVVFTNWSYVPYPKLSDMWKHLSGAWSVDVQRVMSKKVAAYVSSYLAQSGTSWRKVVTFSRDWPKTERPSLTMLEGTWHPDVANSPEFATLWESPNGYRVFIWGPEGPCPCFGGTTHPP